MLPESRPLVRAPGRCHMDVRCVVAAVHTATYPTSTSVLSAERGHVLFGQPGGGAGLHASGAAAEKLPGSFAFATSAESTMRAAAAQALALARAAANAARKAAQLSESNWTAAQSEGQRSLYLNQEDLLRLEAMRLREGSLKEQVPRRGGGFERAVHGDHNMDCPEGAGHHGIEKPRSRVAARSLSARAAEAVMQDSKSRAAVAERQGVEEVKGRRGRPHSLAALLAGADGSRLESSVLPKASQLAFGRAAGDGEQQLLLAGAALAVAEGPVSPPHAPATVAVSARPAGSRRVLRSKRAAERVERREAAVELALEEAVEAEQARAAKKDGTAAAGGLAVGRTSSLLKPFLGSRNRGRLLTQAEEVEYSKGVQDSLVLENVKRQLQEQLGRKPRLPEWAAAVGDEPAAFRRRVVRGRDCRERMVAANMRLVVAVAKNYQGRGIDIQDLVQEGTLGLRKAMLKFDHEKGFKFSTYAHWWIRQAIARAISDHSRTIRLPVHVYELLGRVGKAKRMLLKEHERQPTEAEIAEVLSMSPQKLQAVLHATRQPTSIDRPLGFDDDRTLVEVLPDPQAEVPGDAIDRQLLRRDLEGLLCTLSPREREVMRLRFGLDDGRVKTLEEIGNRFRVTRERIRQIEIKALRKLRHPSRNSVLRPYVAPWDAAEEAAKRVAAAARRHQLSP